MGTARTPITRVFVRSPLGSGGTVRLPAGEAEHVLKVLRGRPGDVLEVVDAHRRLFAAELRGGPEIVVLGEKETPGLEQEGDGVVVLYQAVPKGGRMDLVVEKATELGVDAVVPLLTERGIVEPRGGKVERWRRVAEAAARQSLRLAVPEVAEPVPFGEAAREAGDGGVLLHNEAGLGALETVVGAPARLFVGPEGGWSEGEVRLAETAGLALAQLGPYRLRSETAGVAAVARVRAALTGRLAETTGAYRRGAES